MAFCTTCGTEMTEGMAFCPHCGTPAATEAPQSADNGVTVPLTESAFQAAPAASSVPPAAPVAFSPDTTAQMPPIPPVAASPYQTAPMAPVPPPSQPQPRKSNAPAIIIAVLAVIAVAGIALAALFGTGVLKTGGDTAAPQAAPAVQETADAPANQAPEQAAEAPEAAPEAPSTAPEPAQDPAKEEELRAEKALYDKLIGYYENLSAFDSDISKAAENFNNNFKKESYSTRRDYAEKADRLLSRIQAAQDELSRLSVPSSSINDNSYEALLTCYYDCANRIAVICEAWSISLLYDYPDLWEEEILAPIARDNNGSTNRYYAEFKDTYPSAKPVKP